MPLTPSSLSLACRSVADFLGHEMQAGEAVEVLVGTPAAAANQTGDTQHRLNLFFYGLEPSGFDSQSLPALPWRLRLRCLITPFAIDEMGISAGENDLRILGEVIRLLHERPILQTTTTNGESFRLHAVFEPLDLDSINRLWTTQGEISLRPSVTYEMSLAPIVPREPAVDGPLVGQIGLGVAQDTTSVPAVDVRRSPDVPVTHVDTRRSDWAPQIAFVTSGQCSYVLAFQVGSPELATFTPQVWIAGVPGESVTLTWEQWDRQTGWSPGASTPATASADTIDPTEAGSATLVTVALPRKDREGQFTLYATRQAIRPDQTMILLRSNPLLVTLEPAAGG